MAIATSTAVALALAAASAGAQYYNTQRVAKKQDNQLAAQLRDQGARQQDADAEVNKLITKVSQSTPDAEQAGTLENYLAQIRATTGNATTGLQQVGATSGAYKKAANDAAMGVGDYGGKVASLLSRMDAPALQRQREAMDAATFESNINRIKRFSLGDDYLAKLKLDQIRRNPYLDAGAALAGGAAGSIGSGWSTTGATGGTAFGYGSY